MLVMGSERRGSRAHLPCEAAKEEDQAVPEAGGCGFVSTTSEAIEEGLHPFARACTSERAPA